MRLVLACAIAIAAFLGRQALSNGPRPARAYRWSVRICWASMVQLKKKPVSRVLAIDLILAGPKRRKFVDANLGSRETRCGLNPSRFAVVSNLEDAKWGKHAARRFSITNGTGVQ